MTNIAIGVVLVLLALAVAIATRATKFTQWTCRHALAGVSSAGE